MKLKSLARMLLYFSFIFNLFGFVSFAFPETLGKSAGLPVPPQLIYSSFVAGTILIWAFGYLYLARQKEFNRPLLWIGTVGKFNFFIALLISWCHSEIALQTVMMGLVDLFMGIVWLSYLLTSKHELK